MHKTVHWEDVNADGRTDLLLHFSCADIGLTQGQQTVKLLGRLTTGFPIEGSDEVRGR